MSKSTKFVVPALPTVSLNANQALMLKVVHRDTSSGELFAPYRGYPRFTYPESGIVRPTKWKRTRTCGHGIHGWLWGKGARNCVRVGEARTQQRWLLLVVDVRNVITCDVHETSIYNAPKVKTSSGKVVFAGAYEEAKEILESCKARPHFNNRNYSFVTR